jgi:hypothetical protein
MAKGIGIAIAALAAGLVAGTLYYRRSHAQRDEWEDWSGDVVQPAGSEQPAAEPAGAVVD